MEDVVMNDLTKEDATKAKENPLYADYKKTLINLEKALNIKDTKTMALNFRQLNKFRKGFTDEDISYLVDNLLRHKALFTAVPSLQGAEKVNQCHIYHCRSLPKLDSIFRTRS